MSRIKSMFAVGPNTNPARYSWESSLLFLASKTVWLAGHNRLVHILPLLISIIGNGPISCSDILKQTMSPAVWRTQNERTRKRRANLLSRAAISPRAVVIIIGLSRFGTDFRFRSATLHRLNFRSTGSNFISGLPTCSRCHRR